MATDYFPPIKRAVGTLTNNDVAGRTSLYDRARAALVKQLRAMDPPLSEAQFTKERLMLEDAIRRVEAEYNEEDRPGGARALREIQDAAKEVRELGNAAATAARAGRQVLDPEADAEPEPTRIEPRLGARSEPGRMGRPKAPGPRRDDTDSTRMKIIAGVAVAVLIALGIAGALLLRSGDKATDEAPPIAAPARPETAPAPTPPVSGKLDDRVGEAPKDAKPATLTPAEAPKPEAAKTEAAKTDTTQVEAPKLAATDTAPPTKEPEPLPGVPAETPAPGPVATAEPLAPATTDGGADAVAAVAQRATLYEEDPENPQRGRTFDGTVTWRTESVSAAANAPLETAVRGVVEIPERKIKVQITIRRNTDAALPASHTIELQFAVPSDFPNGGIQNVPGILMKDGSTQRGLPLSGLSVKVTNGFFLVGLNNPPTETGRNEKLMQERSWIDLPILYDNGRRAILTIEKGVPGDKAFADAFAAWTAAAQ